MQLTSIDMCFLFLFLMVLETKTLWLYAIIELTLQPLKFSIW